MPKKRLRDDSLKPSSENKKTKTLIEPEEKKVALQAQIVRQHPSRFEFFKLPYTPYKYLELTTINDAIEIARLRRVIKTKKSPAAILFIDIDDTLINRKKSKNGKRAAYINLENLKKILLELHNIGCQLIPCTSRTFKYYEASNDCRAVLNVLNAVLPDVFNEMVFTGGGRKYHTLDHYADKTGLPPSLIGLMDDRSSQIDVCREKGYKTFQVNLESDRYLEELEAFKNNLSKALIQAPAL